MAIAINPVDKSLIVVIELVLLALDGAAGGAHRDGFPEDDDEEGGFGGFVHNDPIWVNAISSVNISAMSIWPPPCCLRGRRQSMTVARLLDRPSIVRGAPPVYQAHHLTQEMDAQHFAEVICPPRNKSPAFRRSSRG